MMATTADNLDTALSLARAGYHVFPCHSGGEKAKQPMPFIRWPDVSTTDEHQIRKWWSKWPEAAPGLDLAKSGLIVIDCDRHGEHDGVTAFGELMAANGHDPDLSPIVATPNEGNHLFFRQPDGARMGNRRGRLPAGVDVRGSGGYVIAPGSVMADGRLYERHGDLERAPVIPQWLVDLIVGEPAVERTPSTFVGTAPAHDGPASLDELRELLTYVSSSCDYWTWFEVLAAIHAETGGSADGLALADEWSASGHGYPGSGAIAKKWKSFRSTGLTGRTVARYAQEGGADLSAIAIKHGKSEYAYYEYDPVEAKAAADMLWAGIQAKGARRVVESPDGTISDATTGEVIEAVNPLVTSIPYPPGLVGRIAQWIVATSRKPQPALAIGAALTIVGAAAGRQFMGPTEAGTALYVLGLAPTGQGKDMALEQSRRIFTAAGLPQHLGPDEFMSFSSVVNVIKRKPLCLAPMDEFGDFMRRVYDRHGGVHARAIPKILRSLWGGNFKDVSTPEWADRDSITIAAPHLSIFGASTHEQFYSALESGAVADGTLNRFLIIEGVRRPRSRKPKADRFTVPHDIIDDLKMVFARMGDMATTYRLDPNVNPAEQNAVKRLPWQGASVEQRHAEFSREIEDRMFDEPTNVNFLVRTVEMAVRIATIVAAGCHRDYVALHDLDFGIDLARQSADMMIAGATDYMADNEHHANSQRIIRLLKDRGGRAVYRDILRGLRGMRGKDLRELLANMCEAEIIERQEAENPRGPPAIWYAIM